MAFIEKLKNLGSVVTLSLITSILYYCGYLSTEYHNKILGVSIDYTPVEYLKWGGDFFIYSFIDLLNNFGLLLQPSWVDVLFYAGILLIVLISFDKLKIIVRKYLIPVFVFITLALSIYHLHSFISYNMKGDFINYTYFSDYQNLFKKYWIFLACNILIIFLVSKFIWKSELPQKLKNAIIAISLITLMLLPCLYGVYGRGYEYPFIKNKRALLVGKSSDNYFLISLKIKNDETFIKQYNIVKKDSIDFQYEVKYNFFDFIESTIK